MFLLCGQDARLRRSFEERLAGLGEETARARRDADEHAAEVEVLRAQVRESRQHALAIALEQCPRCVKSSGGVKAKLKLPMHWRSSIFEPCHA